MIVSGQASGIPWARPDALPLDLNGPAVAFRAFREEWIEGPAFDLFGSAAAEFGDRTACEDLTRSLTFREVWTACRRLAATLDAAVASGRPVGVLLPNEACYPVAVLACLVAARPCVMIDRNHPPDRVALIVRDAGLSAIILKRSDIAGGMLLPANVRSLAVDDALEDGPLPDRLPERSPSSGAVDFIVYTSGSTGRPKGIALNQSAVLHRAAELVNAVHLRPDDKVASLASPSTIGGLQQIFEVMLSGATLVKLDLQRTGLGSVVSTIAERRITMMFSTPAVWRSIARIDGAAASLASLRCVQTSGDTLLRVDYDLLRQVLPAQCGVLSVYGATEAPALLQWFVAPPLPDDESRVPAGYPLAGFDMAVLDEAGRAVPDGEPGELVVKSPWMSLGIWRDGAVHPGPFERDPRDPEVPVYRTGDIVRRRPDGLFVTLGRKDRQVKILGNRVELAEIETALKRMPDVLDAAVVAARQSQAEPRLLGFFVPRADRPPDLIREIRAHLSQSMPAYMRPSRLFALAELPLLPGRKVDEAALLSLAAAADPAPVHAPDEPASSRSLDMVAKAWRRALGQPPPHDDRTFDESGGDSLHLLLLVAHLEQLHGSTLSLDQFNAGMRLPELALALDRLSGERPATRPAGSPTVFLVPGRGGDEPQLARLRAACQGAVRIESLRYPDLVRLAHGNFDTIVDHITAQIETLHPGGPIALAGYSFGGDVAYAVAHRLLAQGRLVSALLILDTDTAMPATLRRNSWPRRFVRLCERIARRDWLGILEAAVTPHGVSRPASLRAIALVAKMKRPITLNAFFFLRLHVSEMLLEAHRLQWLNGLSCDRLATPIILFRSAQHGGDLGWRERTDSLTIVPVAGDHRDMLSSENLPALSREFIHAIEASFSSVVDSESEA